jgi:hypothetical protein
VDRKTFDFYHDYMGCPKVTVAEVRGYALVAASMITRGVAMRARSFGQVGQIAR